MCGILGYIGSIQENTFHNSVNILKHRGPDDGGVYEDSGFGFGHRRLSILDLSERGHQPMFSPDKSVVIVFNGEIYNHLDIRKEIGSAYSFQSTSDTETILAGYLQYGVSIFAKLNGIFALALYDKRTQKVILARDQFGVKPLYYYHKGSEFYFTSEIKSLLQLPGWDKTIDHSAIVNYIQFLYSPGAQTPFKYVQKFPAGHYLEITSGHHHTLDFKQFYQLGFDGNYLPNSEQEITDMVDKHFSKAVERQLLSDVPVGFFLSGGLDSSLIVAKARAIKGEPLDCFTIATDNKKVADEGFSDDLYYARKVAQKLDVRLHEIEAPVSILDKFDEMIWHLDEPQADPAPLNVLNICTAAKQQGIKVLLGGAGGDDLFSGYRRHQALKLEPFFGAIPKPLSKALGAMSGALPTGNANMRRLRKLLKDVDQTSNDRMAGYFEWLPFDSTLNLFSKDVRNSIGAYRPTQILLNSLKEIPKEKSLLNQMLYWELNFFLRDHNLNYTDKLSMAQGVEVRVPFLDLDLVNFSTQIPPALKLNGKEAKYVLKKVAERYLPSEVIYRKKAGFGAPLRSWIKNDMSDLIHDYLGADSLKKRGIFDPVAVKALIQNNNEGKIDASYSIFSLLAIESWMRQFADVA